MSKPKPLGSSVVRCAPFTRRSLLERLGFGAGAALLAPITQSLLSQAQGATQTRKCAVFALCGNGLHATWNFLPQEFNKYEATEKYFNTKWDMRLPGTTTYTLPTFLEPVKRWRDRMLLIDGLENKIPRSQHSAGYGALSCTASPNDAAAEAGGPPGGITIDQHIAQGIGKNTAHKSILFGFNKYKETNTIFASGRDKPQPNFVNPNEMFKTLFGSITGGEGLQKANARQRLLLDAMKADIARLQRELAPEEKRKLEVHLAAVEDFERQQASLLNLKCDAPIAPAVDINAKVSVPEDILESMWSMATLALACGMTNVVGMACNTGMSHQRFVPFRRIHVGTQFEAGGSVPGHGHEGRSLQKPAMDLIHGFNIGLIAKMIGILSLIKEGDRTIWDNMVAVYTSDNGEAHHNSGVRWPIVVLGNAGGALKSDGRYLAYPSRGTKVEAEKGKWRPLADLYSTLATAVGVPTTAFGTGGVYQTVKGPLPEVLA
ncbi:MAG: DUF1552 domain-containing protein [Deltaproteobacteria bacterium]|nr:DUF1552 domain-containing protein [Deltaproteobacteria bacterium]